MMRSRFLPFYLLWGVALSAVVALAAYGVRAAVVRRSIRHADAQFRAGDLELGFAQLQRFASWGSLHPAFVNSLRCSAIDGHARRGNDATALLLADAVRQDAPCRTPQRPGQACYARLTALLDPLLFRADYPGLMAGYERLAETLHALDAPERLARVERRILLLAPAEPPARDAARAALPSALDLFDPGGALPDLGEGRFGLVCGPATGTYSLSGKRTGELRAGTLVTVVSVTNSPAGDVAVCRLERAGGDVTMVVRTQDLDLHRGDPARLPPELRDLLVRHARLESAVRARKVAAASGSPHFEAYRDARKAYKAFIARSRELTARRDTATGAERIRYGDQLHRMKGEGAELARTYENTKRAYEAWKAEQGDADPELISLQNELETVRSELTRFLPSES